MNSLLTHKHLFKLFLVILKYIPIIMGICYMLNTILGFMRIDIICLSILSGVSILPLTLILIASFCFQFLFIS